MIKEVRHREMVLCVGHLKSKVNIMSNANAKVKGSFSPTAGSSVRRCYDAQGNFLGVIVKQKHGYRVQRTDGKSRVKDTLAAAFASIRRQN